MGGGLPIEVRGSIEVGHRWTNPVAQRAAAPSGSRVRVSTLASSAAALDACEATGTVSLRYLENDLSVARRYPANPNGSPAGITGLTTVDGRVTIMMPHPERLYRTVQHSWAPPEWGEDGGWLRLFRNARRWLD